jgi:hypothetical protein
MTCLGGKPIDLKLTAFDQRLWPVNESWLMDKRLAELLAALFVVDSVSKESRRGRACSSVR